MLALLLSAFALGLDNFAVAIGIGIAGVDARTRWRVGVVFGVFEAGMPILGVVVGRSLATALGANAHWLGAALLIATGAYGVYGTLRGDDDEEEAASAAGQPLGRLLLTGLALSIDNLAVGFSLGARHESLAAAAIVIGAVSVTLSLVGLELGNRIGSAVGRRGELLGGCVLIVVGVLVAADVI
ncbi:manganese efflux pump [Actinospica sp. MGRD01-02]|uniref:Manganese efflux pump n=1 Tax=Actinospica acidithermotolerans TaxID=2828514 RepID=A0A941E5U9_9ACTN|nr:manganese efflux pump [Actinospica acidithermotolerans]MBR7825646.1 manganese efflux pump [Actinospica acidithermotolerans]